MSGKFFLTKSNGTKITLSAVNDTITFYSDGTGAGLSIRTAGGTTYYHATDFQADTGTPQEYTTAPRLTARFEDPLHGIHTHTLTAVGDRLKYISILGGATFVQVTTGGSSAQYPPSYLQSDTSSVCGTA